LLAAEISEKQARSIKYQLCIAKLPLAKDLDDFQFESTPINETLCAISPTATSSHNPKLHPRWRGVVLPRHTPRSQRSGLR
jgi:hypothetical protein